MSSEERAAAKDAEEFAKRRSEGYRKLAGTVVGLYAVFTGGRSIAQFTRDITNSDAATGRFANNVGLSTQELTAWEGAAERAGGSATGIAGSIRGLTQNFQQFALTGQSSVVPYFRYLGIQISDASGKIRPMSELLLDLSQKFQGMDPARAQALGGSLGLDEGTINLLQQGPAAVQALIDKQKQLGLVSKEDSDRAIKFKNSVLDLQQRFTSFGRTILNHVTPAITSLIERFGAWMDLHPEFATTIGDAITNLITWIGNIDWKDAEARAERFGTRVMEILRAIGSWRPPAWMRSFLGIPAESADTTAPAVTSPRGSGPNDDPQNVTAPPVGSPASDSPFSSWLYGKFPGLRPQNAGRAADGTPDSVQPGPHVGVAGNAGSDLSPGPHVDAFGNGGNGTAEPGGKVGAFGSKGVFGPILDLLGMSEGTDKGRGYNETLGYGKYTGGAVNLTDMTLDQVADLQKKMLANGASSTAVGRYQFLSKTLKDLSGQLGLDPSTTKFTADIQDKLANKDIENRGGRGFLGGLVSAHDFMLGLAKEWASVADPDTGKSHYGQGTGATIEQTTRALSQLVPTAGQRWSSNRSTNSSTSHETNINGPINIHTAATDAKGIAKSLGDAVRKHSFVSQADYGIA